MVLRRATWTGLEMETNINTSGIYRHTIPDAPSLTVPS